MARIFGKCFPRNERFSELETYGETSDVDCTIRNHPTNSTSLGGYHETGQLTARAADSRPTRDAEKGATDAYSTRRGRGKLNFEDEVGTDFSRPVRRSSDEPNRVLSNVSIMCYCIPSIEARDQIVHSNTVRESLRILRLGRAQELFS